MGLIRFDWDSQTFIHYLPNTDTVKYISCIQGEARGFFWVETKQRLARFDHTRDVLIFLMPTMD